MYTKRFLAQIGRKLKRLDIPHHVVASRVQSPRSPNGVHPSMVGKVLAKHAVSRPVVEAALSLIAEREASNGTGTEQAA